MTVFFNRSRDRWQYDFQRHGERYQGYCIDPESGEPARNKRQAQQIEALLKAQAGKAPQGETLTTAPGATTFAEVIADYAENHARHCRTWTTMRYQLRELVNFFGLETPAESLKPDHIAQYIDWSRKQPVRKYKGGQKAGTGEFLDTGQKRSPATINNHLALLQAALTRARKQGHIRHVVDIPRLRVPRDLPNPLRPDDAAKILARAEPHLRDVIVLCMVTGMRLQECLSLQWRQVDLDRAVIMLGSNTKAGKGRTVYLGDQALATLQRLHDERPDGHDHVILYRHKGTGAPRPIKDIHKSWGRALERAGLKGRYRFHDTRAAFCTALAELGSNALDIQRLAGHASISTTLRYINASDSRLRETVGRLPTIDCPQ